MIFLNKNIKIRFSTTKYLRDLPLMRLLYVNCVSEDDDWAYVNQFNHELSFCNKFLTLLSSTLKADVIFSRL